MAVTLYRQVGNWEINVPKFHVRKTWRWRNCVQPHGRLPEQRRSTHAGPRESS